MSDISYPPAAGAPFQKQSAYTCPWCGTITDGIQLSCPNCGATVNVRTIVTQSGWSEVPGRKDMARIQFGRSTCQIEGIYVPIADINLSPEDSVYFAHHVLLWKDPQVDIRAMSLKGAWKRMFAGLPLVMTQAKGPGHIAFSRDAPGEMIPLPIQPGFAVDVHEHIFVVAAGQVAYDWSQTGVWFTTGSGDDKETHYPVGMYMDRFIASKVPGLVLLHASGNVFVRQLAQNQSILIKPTALVFKDPTVNMHLHIEQPSGTWRSWGSWGERYLWLRLFGPGRVAIQSAYDPIEDNGRNITSSSPVTQHRW